MTAPLRECPFCGSEPKREKVSRKRYVTRCSVCPAHTWAGTTQYEADEKWNTRPTPSDWVALVPGCEMPELREIVLVTYVYPDSGISLVRQKRYRGESPAVWRKKVNGRVVASWQPLPKAYTPPTPDREGEE